MATIWATLDIKHMLRILLSSDDTKFAGGGGDGVSVRDGGDGVRGGCGGVGIGGER